MDMGVSVIGIGLNVNQTQFLDWPTHPVSLRMILEKEVPLEPLLHELMDAVEARVESLKSLEGREIIRADYLRRLYRYQEWGDYLVEGEGVRRFINGIDSFGRLVTMDAEGREAVYDVKQIQFV